MLNLNNDYIISKNLGRYFVRHICQIFDTFFDYNKEYDYTKKLKYDSNF